MNVKKTQLRVDITNYISEHPNAEIKTIADYFDLQKHALYYHIKLLLNNNDIYISKTEIVNGIEKKYYSVRDDDQDTNIDYNEEESENILNVKTITPHTAEPIQVETTTNKSQISQNTIKSSTVSDKDDAKEITNIEDDKEELNVKDTHHDTLSTQKFDRTSKNQNIIEEISPLDAPDIDDKHLVTEQEISDQKHIITEDISNKTNEKEISTPIIEDLTKDKEEKKKKFNIKISSLFKSRFFKFKKRKDSKTFSEKISELISLFKNKKILELDVFDTFTSRTLLINRNTIISFQNKKDQNKFHIIDKEQLNTLIANKKNKIAVIDEDLLDNHEKIESILNKRKQQELFLEKYISRKYNFDKDDIYYTYEVNNTLQKNNYELNTLFTKKSYLSPFLEMLEKPEIPNNIYFMSFAGIFSRYNQRILKNTAVTLYVYAGKKDCVVTLLERGNIIAHRKILISNRELDRKTYRREVINRLTKTIEIFSDDFDSTHDTFSKCEKILFCGPNLSQSIVDEVSDKFNVQCEVIEGILPNNDEDAKINDYIPTLKFISKSLSNLGNHHYVFDQKKKKIYRLNRIKKILAYVSLILFLSLIVINIKVYEQKMISTYNLDIETTSFNSNIELIKKIETNLQNNIQKRHFDNYLNNIYLNKKNIKKILLFMNSDIFDYLQINSLDIETTNHDEIDIKNQKIYISGSINDLKPEALLESKNILNALSDISFLTDVELKTSSYQKGRLPITIIMEIKN